MLIVLKPIKSIIFGHEYLPTSRDFFLNPSNDANKFSTSKLKHLVLFPFYISFYLYFLQLQFFLHVLFFKSAISDNSYAPAVIVE